MVETIGVGACATALGDVCHRRVGVLVPGAVDTPIWDALGASPPREKMLKPEDVARAAVLMATLPPHASLEELTLLPAGGIL